jgi:hypothetical protein
MFIPWIPPLFYRDCAWTSGLFDSDAQKRTELIDFALNRES